MKALLLAAGFGTRLHPFTLHTPKCLAPIHGKPLLGYWLDLLMPNGIKQVLINTHYLPELVRDFVHSSRWRDSCQLIHEPHLLGTGGTILKNQKFLREGAFLLAHADNLTRFDIKAFIAGHAQRPPGVEITMMTFDTDSPQNCGIVEEDSSGIVINFYEKSQLFHGTRANAAVYILEPTVIDYLDSLGLEKIDFSTEVLPHYLGRMQAYHNTSYHRDIGTPESLQLAEIEY